MANQQTYRLFVAIEAPDEVKVALRAVQDSLRAKLGAHCVRWTSMEQLHLTLRFLGNIDATNVDQLSRELSAASADFPPIELSAQGLGFFPPQKLPRVIWAGLGGDVERLSKLAGKIAECTAPFSAEPPENEFHPHLTLGRCKRITRGEGRILMHFARNSGILNFGHWRAKTVVLFRSEFSDGGHRHIVLAQFSLDDKE